LGWWLSRRLDRLLSGQGGGLLSDKVIGWKRHEPQEAEKNDAAIWGARKVGRFTSLGAEDRADLAVLRAECSWLSPGTCLIPKTRRWDCRFEGQLHGAVEVRNDAIVAEGGLNAQRGIALARHSFSLAAPGVGPGRDCAIPARTRFIERGRRGRRLRSVLARLCLRCAITVGFQLRSARSNWSSTPTGQLSDQRRIILSGGLASLLASEFTRRPSL
jgi:hypothetical protein